VSVKDQAFASSPSGSHLCAATDALAACPPAASIVMDGNSFAGYSEDTVPVDFA